MAALEQAQQHRSGPAVYGRTAPAGDREACGNLLLRSLDPEAFAWLSPHLEPVPAQHGHVVVASDAPITFVSFPESGLTSINDVLHHGAPVQVALIGRDGMINSHLLLGCERAAHEAVQIDGGHSLRLDGEVLQELCARYPSACRLLMRFIQALSFQTACTLVSSSGHTMSKRLSRLILMCHDRASGDRIQIGHEPLARMLGVRRATVSDTLHVLEGDRAVKSRRGEILIRDRMKLAAIAGASYGQPEDYYRALIAPFGKGAADALPARAIQ